MDLNLDRQYEMHRLGILIQNMIGKATSLEIVRVSKLSTKIIENESWTRWGKDNEVFLYEMEKKYCNN